MQGAAIQRQQMGNSHPDNGHLPVGNKSCHEPLMFFGRLAMVDDDEKDDQKAKKAILLNVALWPPSQGNSGGYSLLFVNKPASGAIPPAAQDNGH